MGVRMLTAQFETDLQTLAGLLPPPLQPAGDPVGLAWVRDVGNSTTVGSYTAAGVGLRAQLGATIGYYVLSCPVSTPAALTHGREIYGEPAKLARVVFEQQDDHVWGSAERHAVRFLSVRGRCTDYAPSGREQGSFFHFKYLLRADGAGFDSPPVLMHLTEDVAITTARRGRGEIVFRPSAHDPVSEVPVKQVLDAAYSQGHLYRSARPLATVDPEAFLPYAFLKSDDIGELAENTVLHAQAMRRTSEGKGQWRKTA
jgi:acetoacetate decarboxylase